jgi:AraC-like DNA-binding protein
VLDLNSSNVGLIEKELERVFKGVLGRSPERQGPWFCLGPSKLRLVTTGLPDDVLIRSLGITRFAIDDYLLKLFLNESSLQEFCRSEKWLSWRSPSAEELRNVLQQMAGVLVLRTRLDSSKRYLDLIDAAIGLRVSPKGRAVDLVKRCPTEILDQVFGDLRSAVENDPPDG